MASGYVHARLQCWLLNNRLPEIADNALDLPRNGAPFGIP